MDELQIVRRNHSYLACAVIICGRESFLRTTVIHTTNSLFR